ncbi:oxidoreductase [Gordonia sputi]
MGESRWSLSDAPDLSGRTAVVTGANSGVGLATAGHLARLGARVVLACRNVEAAERARDAILAEGGSGGPGSQTSPDIEIVQVDLSELDSVRRAADELVERFLAIDILVNNAGVMRAERELTKDGVEMDFATNFLGHFALTGLLLGPLRAARNARIVSVCSKLSSVGRLDPDDLAMDVGYSAAAAYSRSKLAQAIFAVALQRRLALLGDGAPSSVLAHPGATHSGVMRDQGMLSWLFTTPTLRWVRRTFIMDPAEGALSSVRAATDPGLLGGQYIGPRGFLELSGAPVLVAPPEETDDLRLARALWEAAEKATGVGFDLPGYPVNPQS